MTKLTKILKKVTNDIKKLKGSSVKKFRLQGRHLFLTYAQCPLNRQEVLDQLIRYIEPRKIVKYVICTELHKDGQQHIHTYLGLDERVNIVAKDRLDLEIKNNLGVIEKKHGNYQSCRNYNRVINYIIKDSKDMAHVLTNMNLDDTGREINVWLEVSKKNKEGDINESLKMVESIAPRLYVTDYTKVKRSLLDMQKDAKVRKEARYPLASFDIPKEVKEWADGPKNKTLYLSGGTGLGKTEMLKSLFEEKFGPEFIRVNNLEGLKQLETKPCKGVILDDIDLSQRNIEELLGLLDVQNNHTQKILYGTVEIPQGLTRAIVSNKKMEEFTRSLNVGLNQVEALLRRCLNIDLGNKKLILRMELEVSEDKEK